MPNRSRMRSSSPRPVAAPSRAHGGVNRHRPEQPTLAPEHGQGHEVAVEHAVGGVQRRVQRVEGHQIRVHHALDPARPVGRDQLAQREHPAQPAGTPVLDDIDEEDEIRLAQALPQRCARLPHGEPGRHGEHVVGHDAAHDVVRVAAQLGDARRLGRRQGVEQGAGVLGVQPPEEVGGEVGRHEGGQGAALVGGELLEDLELARRGHGLQRVRGERVGQEHQQLGRVQVGQGIHQPGDLARRQPGDAPVVARAGVDGAGVAPQELDVFPVVELALDHPPAGAPAGDATQHGPHAGVGGDQAQARAARLEPEAEVVGAGGAAVLQVQDSASRTSRRRSTSSASAGDAGSPPSAGTGWPAARSAT